MTIAGAKAEVKMKFTNGPTKQKIHRQAIREGATKAREIATWLKIRGFKTTPHKVGYYLTLVPGVGWKHGKGRYNNYKIYFLK